MLILWQRVCTNQSRVCPVISPSYIDSKRRLKATTEHSGQAYFVPSLSMILQKCTCQIHVIVFCPYLSGGLFMILSLNGCRYFRDFEVETLGCKPTGRRCSDPECGAKLIDTIVDWEVIFSSQKLSIKHQHHQMFDSTWFLHNSLKFDVSLVGSKGHDILS